MSENVKRYYPIGPMAADDYGYYVKYDDYLAAIEDSARAENAQREAEKRYEREKSDHEEMLQLRDEEDKILCEYFGIDFPPNIELFIDAIGKKRTALAAAEERARVAEEEIRGIDSVLARRPALANCKTRREMVELACVTAGKVTDEAAHLKRKVELLTEEQEASVSEEAYQRGEITRLTAEVERLTRLLPPDCGAADPRYVGQGNWAVFAEKVMGERDEARARGWEEEARRYCSNSDFWREKYESLRRNTVRVDVLMRWMQSVNWSLRRYLPQTETATVNRLWGMLATRSQRGGGR